MNKSIDDRRLIFIYGTCFEDDRRSLCDLHVLHGMATYMEDDRRSSSHLPHTACSGISQYWGRRGGIRSVAWLSLPRHSRKLREVPADLEAEANLGTCISITSNIVKLAVGLPLNALG